MHRMLTERFTRWKQAWKNEAGKWSRLEINYLCTACCVTWPKTARLPLSSAGHAKKGEWPLDVSKSRTFCAQIQYNLVEDTKENDWWYPSINQVTDSCTEQIVRTLAMHVLTDRFVRLTLEVTHHVTALVIVSQQINYCSNFLFIWLSAR